MRIVTLLPACMLMLPVLAASSSPWGVQSIHQTNIPSADLLPGVLSPEGDIYFAGAGQAGTISKENAAGQLVFTAQIPGEIDLEAILLGPDGNLYVAGYATSGVFVITAGAYEATGPGPFLCRLSGADGHVLFCTFIDVPSMCPFPAVRDSPPIREATPISAVRIALAATSLGAWKSSTQLAASFTT